MIPKTKSGWILSESTLIFVWRHSVEQVPLPQGIRQRTRHFPFFSAGFLLQTQSVGNEGNELTVGGLALMVVYSVTE